MKKTLALMIALLLVFALAACGGGSTPTAKEFESADIFWYKFDDQYLTGVRNAMTGYLDGAGIKYEHYDCEGDQAKQNDLVDTAISKGSSLLVVNIVDTAAEEAALNIVNKAKTAGIPIVFFNREVTDQVVNSYDQCVFVGTRAAEAGEMQGELAGEVLAAAFDKFDLNGDGTLSYIMFKGELGNPEAEARTQFAVDYCNEALKAAGLPELVYYDPANTDKFQACDWNTEQAQNAMATALGTNPMDGANPIEVVFCNNDGMALGVVNALGEVGWNTGEGNAIPVFGVDAEDFAIEMIGAGKMAGTIKQDGDAMAKGIVEFVKATKNGTDWKDVLSTFNVDANVNKIRIPYAKMS